MSIWSPCFSARASTTAAGRRMARLLPHLATSMQTSRIYLRHVYLMTAACKCFLVRDRHSRARREAGLPRQGGLGGFVFGGQPGDEFAGRRDRRDRADALAAAPDVAPGLGLLVAAGAEVHLGRIGLGKVFRIQAGALDARAQIVAVNPGEAVGVENVLAAAFDDHLLVSGNGVGLLRGDESRADVGEVGAHGLGGEDRAAIG